MIYEWNREKDAANWRKHGVPFFEAVTVFQDPLAVTFDDPDHSAEERRFVTIGMSQRGRILFVATAERGERLRIITARRATRKEAHGYQEGEF